MTTEKVSAPTKHIIRWFVVRDGERIPHAANMRGSWPGYDATCSCGWDSHTGGATRTSVRHLIRDHKHDVAYEELRVEEAVKVMDHSTNGTVPCTATKQYDATSMAALRSHATTDTEHPLCTGTLNVLTYQPGVTADTENVDCKRCLKKMEKA